MTEIQKEYETIVRLLDKSYTIDHLHAAIRWRREFQDKWQIRVPATDNEFHKLIKSLLDKEQEALNRLVPKI